MIVRDLLVGAGVLGCVLAGCRHPATPDFSAFVEASQVQVFDREENSPAAVPRSLAVKDMAASRRIAEVLRKYDGQWKVVSSTPPVPRLSVVASDNEGDYQDLFYLDYPDPDTHQAYVQKRIDGVYYWVRIGEADFDLLMEILGVSR